MFELSFLHPEDSLKRKAETYSVIVFQISFRYIFYTEQNQLTWYGHVQRMAEGRLPKISLKWMAKQNRARGRPKRNWMEGIRKAVN